MQAICIFMHITEIIYADLFYNTPSGTRPLSA